MEAQETALKIPRPLVPSPAVPWLLRPAWWGPILLIVSVGLIGAYVHGGIISIIGRLLLVALVGAGFMVWSLQKPLLPLIGLLVVAPFNYGFMVGGASIKLSELVAVAMAGLILMRLVSGDEGVYARLRRAGAPLVALTLLGVMAVTTALPHPNVFNVRYEIENYLVFAYVILLFRRSWWKPLLITLLAMVAVESVIALTLKFGFGLTGTSFFGVGGGVSLVHLQAEDLESLAGGKFRLSGTFGHKNMLAGFYILTLPVIGLEMLHRGRLLWLAVLLPALATLALTDSMTGWTAMVVVVVLALIHLRRFDYLALLVLLVLPLAAVGLYKFGDSIFSRIDQLFSSQEGWGTVSSRVEILNISRNLLHQYPWMGIGRNNFLEYGKTYYTHAHNLYLMKMIEMGIPAGIAFSMAILAMMARAWWTILRQARRLAAEQQYYRTLGLWLGCLGFLSMNCFDYNYAHFSLGPIFMAMLGILMAVAMGLEDFQSNQGK